jgi:hypothetical protein
MDADGSRSKSIARSLRKLGVKASIRNLQDFFYYIKG